MSEKQSRKYRSAIDIPGYEKMVNSIAKIIAKSTLHTKATESLETQIEEDLQIPDPSGDIAKAVLKQAFRNSEEEPRYPT